MLFSGSCILTQLINQLSYLSIPYISLNLSPLSFTRFPRVSSFPSFQDSYLLWSIPTVFRNPLSNLERIPIDNMQFAVSTSLVAAVLALSPAVAAAVPNDYRTAVNPQPGPATTPSSPGNGQQVYTLSQSMTKSSKHVNKPTVTCSHSSACTTTKSKTHSKTHSAPGSKPTDCKKSGGALKGLSKTQQIMLSDTRADAINNVLTKNKDFVFHFGQQKKNSTGTGKGGEVVPANRKTFPALTGTGMGMAVAFLGPCGFNTPHVHPRASEMAIVTEGTIVSSMLPENGVNNADGTPREILNTMHKHDATIFYQGAVHSQFNPDCKPATFVAALSSEDFGTGQVAQELFGTSNKAVAAVFGNAIDGADVDKLRGKISKNVALGVEQCLKKCKINKRS
ncbi:Spherulin-1A [Apiospora arundinis]